MSLGFRATAAQIVLWANFRLEQSEMDMGKIKVGNTTGVQQKICPVSALVSKPTCSGTTFEIIFYFFKTSDSPACYHCAYFYILLHSLLVTDIFITVIIFVINGLVLDSHNAISLVVFLLIFFFLQFICLRNMNPNNS